MGSSASKSNLARRRMAKNAREQTSFAREQEKFAREQKKIAREQIMVYLLASNLLLLAEVPLTGITARFYRVPPDRVKPLSVSPFQADKEVLSGI